MRQTRLGSWLETGANIVIGFAINWIANMLILPRSIEETVYLYVDEGGLVWGSTTRLLDTYRKALGSARVTLVEGQWAEGTKP